MHFQTQFSFLQVLLEQKTTVYVDTVVMKVACSVPPRLVKKNLRDFQWLCCVNILSELTVIQARNCYASRKRKEIVMPRRKKIVMPAKAGIQEKNDEKKLDASLRWHDRLMQIFGLRFSSATR